MFFRINWFIHPLGDVLACSLCRAEVWKVDDLDDLTEKLEQNCGAKPTPRVRIYKYHLGADLYIVQTEEVDPKDIVREFQEATARASQNDPKHLTAMVEFVEQTRQFNPSGCIFPGPKAN